MSEKDREVLFGNEAFAIGVLQAVSGATAAGAITKSEELKDLSGELTVLLFVTCMVLTLLCAVWASFFRHQYKKWDVKALASESRVDNEESQNRSASAQCYLKLMRHFLTIAVWTLTVGFGGLVVSFWCSYLS